MSQSLHFICRMFVCLFMCPQTVQSFLRSQKFKFLQPLSGFGDVCICYILHAPRVDFLNKIPCFQPQRSSPPFHEYILLFCGSLPTLLAVWNGFFLSWKAALYP